MQIQKSAVQEKGTLLLVLEGKQMKVLELKSQEEWKIGRYAPTMLETPDILFSSRLVSKEHGCLKKIGEEWFYIDNPQNLNGTYHNGRKIPRPKQGKKRPALLENADVLYVGKENLNQFDIQGVLILFLKSMDINELESYLLPMDNTTFIGRSCMCDIVEKSLEIEEKHAKIVAITDQYYLSDCGSSSGTFLNGVQIKSSTLLHNKDIISIGDCTYFFFGNRLFVHK